MGYTPVFIDDLFYFIVTKNCVENMFMCLCSSALITIV